MDLRPVRFATRDRSAAEAFLRAVWDGVYDIEFGPDFSLEVTGVRGDEFSIRRVRHASTARLHSQPGSRLHVLELLHGAARLTSDNFDIQLSPGQVVAVDSGAPSRLISERATFGIVTLGHSLLGRTAGVEPETLVFPPAPPASPDWVAHWRAAVRHTTKEVLARPEVAAQDQVVEESVRLLAVAALAAFPYEVEEPETGSTMSAAIRRATAYIDAHASQPLTVAQIAEAAHTSVRSLQQGFARHYDTSPTAYLRRVRLERAHQELVEATPDNGSTVADVAQRWGFGQPSRFAAHYREAFGRLPSETLRTTSR